MANLSDCGLDSAQGIFENLKKNHIFVSSISNLENSQNIIYLADNTTINWKMRKKQIRVNCQEDAKNVIEKNTGLRSMLNGKGDPTRPFSFLLNTSEEYEVVIKALKTIESYNA